MKEVFIKTLSMGIVLCILTACTGRPSPSTYSNSSATSSDSNVEADNKNTEPTATGFKNLTRPYYSVLGCGGESGYYETRARDDGSANVTYIDYSSQKEIYLCNAPGCAHDNEGCTSWISAENAGVFPLISSDHLLLIHRTYGGEEGKQSLSRIDAASLDGSNRKTLIEQTSFSAAYATVSPNPLIFVAAALFALLTVKISIRKPVKMAAKVSPIEALRYTDSDTAMKGKRKKRIRSGNLQKRMAWENLGRDKKRTILVILSLSLSIILTNTVFNFSNSVDPENAIQNMINFDFCIGQSSLLDYYRVSEESALSQSFIQAVEQQDGFDYGGCEYGCKSSYKSETTKQAYNQQEDGSFSTYLYGLDPLLLSRVQVVDGELNMEKLASGNYILEGAYVGTRGDLDKSSLNHSVGDQVQVSCNGIVRDFTVLAHVVANEANTYDWVGSCFFLPSEVYEDFTCNNYVMSYSFDVSQGKGPEMDAFLDEYTKNVEPTMTYKSKSTIMAGVTDIQNMVVSIGGTMAFIIGLIGILNFANTMLTSIFTRRREFATLQSVGMTGRQLLKMLRQEGCAYVLLATVVSVPLSLIGALQVIRPICKQIWFLNFKLEVWPMLVMPVLLLLFGLAIPYIAYRLISRQSVTERLKVGE